MKHQWLVSFWLLGLVCALGPSLGRQVAETLPAGHTRHRRSLLGTTQQISQCDWIAGEGCALHPSYASFALNRTGSDVVAQYVASSLTCASLVDRGTCESTSYCFWDPAFTNGQQGCFLHEAAMLALQLQCVQPQHQRSLTKLQTCMAARRSCQCSSSSSSSCQLHQQQLMSTYSSTSSSKVCQSLLGCWLSGLTSSSIDVTQLVEVQLVLVQPKLEQLDSGSAANIGRRRVLLDLQLQQGSSSSDGASSGFKSRQLLQAAPALSQPVLDDTASSPTSGSSDSGGSGEGGLIFESGSYATGAKPAASSSAPLIGMNGGVLNEAGTAGTTSHTPVENANNVPGLSADNGGGTNGDGGYELESGTINGNDWVSASTPVDPDQLFGNSSTGSGSAGSGGSAGAGSNGSSGGGGSNAGGTGDSSVQMTGGNAPASFWQCAANAAVKADQTRKWADVDYNSKSLTLATWLRVIQPTALIDWGVEVLECFKAEVSILPTASFGTADLSKPNKESTEYAIVALIRAYSGQADVFRAYLQSSASSRVGTGLSGLQKLVDESLAGQYKALRSKYNSTAGYDRDVLLQAAAVVADMQWFIMGARDLASAMTGALQQQQQQQVIEGVISYGEDMMRRTLYWLFQLQFAGPPAHLPGVPASTPESSAVVAAFDGLSTAALPGPMVAADAPAWQQMQGMAAVACGWVASLARLAKNVGDKVNAPLLTGNTIDGLAKAHIHNLWRTRLDLARAGASEAARNLALADPSQFNVRYQPVRLRQVSLLNLLQEQVIASNSSDVAGMHMQKSVQDLVAAAGGYLLAGYSDSAAAGVPAAQQQQQQLLAGALSSASQLAYLVRQCKGSPAGLRPLSAAAAALVGVPATPAAACSQLGVETQKIATQALAGSDALVLSLVQDMNQQWACNALPAPACSSNPACKLAIAATLAPGSSVSSSTSGGSTGSSSGSPGAQAVLLAGASKAGNVYSCEAADWALRISSKDNGTKTAIAVGNEGCQEFMLMPACEEKGEAAVCSGFASCRWEVSSQRNLIHTALPVGNLSGAAAGAPSSATGGACAMDWVVVLQSDASTAYSGLSSMINMCRAIRDTAACAAQTMLISLEPQAASSSNMARIWVPVLVVAAVLGVLLFVGAVYWRRRSYTARRAAEEARSAGQGGRGGRKAGKDGKAKSKTVKKKVKRAEPGSYKPDLMRDSFTDYMRSAPQQFENGVAIAKAAMAAGSLDVGVVVADVAGGRSMQHATPVAHHAAAVASSTASSHRSGGSGPAALPPLPPPGFSNLQQQQHAAAQVTGGFAIGSGSDLIQLQAADGNTVSPVPLPAAAAAAAASGGNAMLLYQHPSSEVWGAAGAASASGLSGGGVLSGGVSGSLLSGGLSGQVDLIDTGASLALTSSLGLVSSLPHHSSVALSAVSGATGQAGLGVGGADGGGARVGFTGYDMNPGVLGFGGMQLPLGPRESQEAEEVATTPTSSCCHDSVCTFRQGPGSSVGAGSSTGFVGSSSRAGSSSSNSVWRAGSASSSRLARPASGNGSTVAAPAGGAGGGSSARGGIVSSLSGALSGALSRSSWSSAVSTDMLITQQSSAVLDP